MCVPVQCSAVLTDCVLPHLVNQIKHKKNNSDHQIEFDRISNAIFAQLYTAFRMECTLSATSFELKLKCMRKKKKQILFHIYIVYVYETDPSASLQLKGHLRTTKTYHIHRSHT